MRELIGYWRDEIGGNWIIVPVLLVFAVTTSFNAKMGYEIGGGADEFPLSLAYGMVFIGLAVLGAYGFAQAGSHAGGMRAALLAVGFIQLAVGLQAGWQSLGLTLSKAAVGLEDKANARQTADDALKKARAARDKLGTPRTIATIAADEDLECRIKSAQYKDGVGPKCTRLRGELADARRADELDKEIVALTDKVGNAPKIKDAAANFEVAIALVSGAKTWWTGKQTKITPDDARFSFLVFMVAVLETVGTLGFWIADVRGSRGGPSAPHSGPPSGMLESPEIMAARKLNDYHDQVLRRRAVAPGAIDPVVIVPQSAAQSAPLLPQSSGPVASPGTHGGSAHGAPINFNLTVGPSGSLPPAALEAARATAVPLVPVETPKSRSPRPDVGLVLDAPPVDRSHVQQLTDSLLAFKSACVVKVLGGNVAAEQIYARYLAWKGPGAIAAPAFHHLFGEVAAVDRIDVAGNLHYRDVALRAPVLAAVG